jgi:hypothetical protein
MRKRHAGHIIQFCSTELSEGRPEYEAVVGRAASMQRELNGRQPGDPLRAAQVILGRLHNMETPYNTALCNLSEKLANGQLAPNSVKDIVVREDPAR